MTLKNNYGEIQYGINAPEPYTRTRQEKIRSLKIAIVAAAALSFVVGTAYALKDVPKNTQPKSNLEKLVE